MASLREVFAQVREQGAHGDPAGLLQDSDHTDLPEPLLSLAIVNFADTLPAAAAEHLAGFVVPHSGVQLGGADHADPPATDGLELLATAPTAFAPEPADLDGVATEAPAEPPDGAPAADHPLDAGFGGGPDGLDFGTGDREPGHSPGDAPWDAARSAARSEPAPTGDLGPAVPVEVGPADPGVPAPDATELADQVPADAAGSEDPDGPEDGTDHGGADA